MDIWEAIKSRNLSHVKQVLKNNVDTNAKRNGKTPLMYALELEPPHNGVVKEVISYSDVNILDNHMQNSYFYAKSAAHCKMLLGAGVNIGQVNDQGKKAVDVFADKKLKRLANLTSKEHIKWWRYLFAEISSFTSTTLIIKNISNYVSRGLDVNYSDEYGNTLLSKAVERNRCDEIPEYLISLGAAPNTKDKDGNSPILWAAYNKMTNVFPLLIKFGANIKDCNNDGENVLHKAVVPSFFFHGDILTIAVKCNVDVNCVDKNGNTPLMLAGLFGSTKKIQTLLDAGADTAIQNAKGETALDIALGNGHEDAAQIIKRHIAKVTEMSACCMPLDY